MKLFTRILLILATTGLILFAGISWFFSGLIIQPMDTSMESDKVMIAEKWGTSFDNMMSKLPKPLSFAVESEDDISIKGWYFDHPDTANCAVVFVHGWGTSRAGMLKFADIFWDCSCDLVFYDHRSHNESGGTVATAGIKEKIDLINVTEWLQEKTGLEDQQIAWFGESWGGATVLQAGALEKNVAFIVADSPFQDWNSAIFERAERSYGFAIRSVAPFIMNIVDYRTGIDHNLASPLEAAKNIKEPVLLIHSKGDNSTASLQSVNIAKNLNPDNSKFHHTDWGSDHVMDVIMRPEEYRQLVYDFIKEEVVAFGKCN